MDISMTTGMSIRCFYRWAKSYDPQARVDLGVNYRWDTAYYHGHYYMYF